MKKLFGAALLLASASVFGGTPVNNPALEKYATRAMMNCPGSTVALTTSDTPAPDGFTAYRIVHKSSDTRCGRSTSLLTSKTTDTYIVGDVFRIPAGKEPLDKRLATFAGSLLKRTLSAKISATPTKDGLRPVTMVTKMPQGNFEYHGWVDKSGKSFIVGRLGSKNTDPGESLLGGLKASTGATRGNAMGRIRIVEISDFQCPTCKFAHELLEPAIRRNLNKISYTRLDLPLFEHHDWSLKAAMAGRAIQKVAPDKYWLYVDQIFANQEVLSKSSIDSVIRDFAADNGIDWKKIAPLYDTPAARAETLAQVSRTFDLGVFSTPTFIVNGQVVFFGNEGEYLRSYIDSLLRK